MFLVFIKAVVYGTGDVGAAPYYSTEIDGQIANGSAEPNKVTPA